MRRRHYLLLPCLLLLVCLPAAALWPRARAAAAPTTGLYVVGNKMLTRGGQRYTPEGISVYGGLESPKYNANIQNVYAQINAAHTYWHANTVRLQVAESNLFSQVRHGQTYNQDFLASMDKQVRYAHQLGMAVVINDQTEFTNNTPSPTAKTARFWDVVAQQYKKQPYVIFDIFNEPRLTSVAPTSPLATGVPYSPVVSTRLMTSRPAKVAMSATQAWRLWRDGGSVNGTNYLGMQTVVDGIRDAGSANLIWVEGTYDARRLPPNQFLLHGSNLAYAIHHPDLNRPSSWQRIGSLAATQPVVEGEWAQYQSAWAECYATAYTSVPRYLHYLHAHNVGVIAWSLQANSLLKGDSKFGQPHNLNSPRDPSTASSLKAPNTLTPDYACGARQHGQGAGQQLQNYFAKNSVQYTF